jgi:hypothetical protein
MNPSKVAQYIELLGKLLELPPSADQRDHITLKMSGLWGTMNMGERAAVNGAIKRLDDRL